VIVVQIAGIVVSILLVLVLLPRVIFSLDRVPGTFLDRTMAGAVYMTALTVAAMYVLGTFGLLEMLGLIVVWVGAWWLNKGRRTPPRFSRIIERTLEASDRVERDGAKGFARGRVGGARASMRHRASEVWARRPEGTGLVTSVAVLVVLTAAAGLRFSRAFGHLDLVPQDSFLALSWTTFLNKGRVLADGTYPQGSYMWMSMLHRFYPFGVYNFIRWIGPTMNVLELVTLYWVVSRATRNRAAGLLALAVFGMFAGHPALLVDWTRQIGSMSQEFALAFALCSLVFGARYMAGRQDHDLALAGSALFVAATSNTLVVPLLALGYVVIVVVGLVTASWDRRSFVRLVAVGMGCLVAANLYFALGAIRHIPLNASFDLYLPTNRVTLAVTPIIDSPQKGRELAGNPIYQLGTIGAAVGIVCGVALLRRRPEDGRLLVVVSTTAFAAMLIFDLVLWKSGLLFRVRQGWITAELVMVGLGVGIGGPVLAIAGALEDNRSARWAEARKRVTPGLREGVAFIVAALLFLGLWPQYSAAARTVFPSGYPQASQVAVDVAARSLNLTFTFVGVSEQYQEALDKGFFTEAWVFARDITMHDARDPAYELPIPTESVYIFLERVPFVGPQAAPVGPTQEYYRDQEKRARLMARIRIWSDAYRQSHHDMTTVYEDGELAVYRIKRKVDVATADLSPAFKDYTWLPGEIFDTDNDVTDDVVIPDPASSTLPEGSPRKR